MSELVETIAEAVYMNPDLPWNQCPDGVKSYYRKQAQSAIAAMETASTGELSNAAREVIKTFHATGTDKTGQVKWSIDPIAMRRLIIAVGKFDWHEAY